jgi:hypothetical protein
VNIGTFIEIERHEAVERAMQRYYAQKREAARERRTSTTRSATGLRPGARRISRAEALKLVAAKNPSGARRLAQTWDGVLERR